MNKTISVYSIVNVVTGNTIYIKDIDRKRTERLAVAASNNNPAGDYRVKRSSVKNPEYVPA